ncbi:hypothetical protein GCM10023229_12690 [Flavisolibacter ginsenosidimutans]
MRLADVMISRLADTFKTTYPYQNNHSFKAGCEQTTGKIVLLKSSANRINLSKERERE